MTTATKLAIRAGGGVTAAHGNAAVTDCNQAAIHTPCAALGFTTIGKLAAPPQAAIVSNVVSRTQHPRAPASPPHERLAKVQRCGEQRRLKRAPAEFAKGRVARKI